MWLIVGNAIIGQTANIIPDPAVLCANGSILIDGNPSGGTLPYIGHSWTGSGVSYLDNPNIQSPVFSGAPANTYTLTYTVTDGDGNTDVDDIIITVNPLLPVSISITASANPICAGTSVTFTATPINGGTTPLYQWQVNGANVGANSPTYNYTPANGDIVTVVLTSSETCTSGDPATSNSLTMIVNPILPVSVSIAASTTTVCTGASVTFTASPTNGGTTPTYQWRVNSNPQGTNSPTFTYSPANGDNVLVVLTSSETCVLDNPATSNTVSITHYDPLLPGSINTTTSQFCLGGTGPIGGTNPPFGPATGGSGSLSYTWQIQVGCTGPWVDISGTNTTSYTPVPPATTACFRRKVTDAICFTEAFTESKTFEIYPELVSQNIEPTPINLTVCSGTSISATFTGGSGGFPGAYTDVYEYSINGGTNWTTYIPSDGISTAGLSGNNIIQIRTRRIATGVDGCDYGEYVTVSWSVNPLPTATISGTTAVCQSAAALFVTFTGADGTAPYTFTYNINGGTNSTVTTISGNSVTVSAPTGTAGTFIYNLVGVQDASSTACYQVQTGSATITVIPYNTITLTSAAGTDQQTRCINTAVTDITYSTTGATDATFSGLPAGVSGSWIGNVVTISGTPTVSGPFSYTVTLIGGCGTVNATGTITVTPNNTVTAASSTPTLCINTALTNITHTTTGATGIGISNRITRRCICSLGI